VNHTKILKRALEITTNYRVLWVFGIILALTAGGVGGSSGGGSGGGSHGGNGGGPGVGPGWPGSLSQETITGLIIAGVVLLIVILLLVVASTVARYVAETSIIKMVDHYEDSGEQISLREGFRLGWSRTSGRLFLLDLLVNLPVFLGVILLLAIAALPLLVWFVENDALRVIGSLASAGLMMTVILLAVLVGVVLSVLVYFFRRALVLENLGVVDALRRGWALVRRRPGDVVIMALIIYAMGLAFTIITLPVGLLLMVAGAVIAGLPALLVGSLVALFASSVTGIIVGVVVGLPLFILVLAIPLAFIGGLWQTYLSSTWTLTYRELVALENVE